MTADESTPDFSGVEAGPESSDVAPEETSSAAVLPVHPSITALSQALGEQFVLRHEVVSGDQHVVWVPADEIVRILGWLKDTPEHRFDLLADVSAVDYGGGRPLEIYYQLWSIPNRRALRVKCTLPLDALEIDSVAGLWNAANWLEREVFDMFGIRFRGHPDLRRILMPDHYAEGHPLRKDFPLRGRFSRAEQTRRALEQDVENYYIPEEMIAGGEPLLVESAPEGEDE